MSEVFDANPPIFHDESKHRIQSVKDIDEWLIKAWPEKFKRKGKWPMAVITITQDDEIRGEYVDFWTSATSSRELAFLIHAMERIVVRLKEGNCQTYQSSPELGGEG